MIDSATPPSAIARSRATDDSGFSTGSGPAASPPIAHGGSRLRWLATVLFGLYLAGITVAWATNAVDGYFGIPRVTTRADEPDRLLVRDVAPGSPADRAGLRPGHVVLAVDGTPVAEAVRPWLEIGGVPPDAAPAFRVQPLAVPPGDAPAFRRVAGERRPGESRVLQIERPGSLAEERTLVLASRLAAPGVVTALLTWHLVGLLSLAMGALAALRRPAELAARLLFVMGSCFALALVLLSWVNRALPEEVALALARLTALLLVLGCAALLHLFLVFPVPHPLLRAYPITVAARKVM